MKSRFRTDVGGKQETSNADVVASQPCGELRHYRNFSGPESSYFISVNGVVGWSVKQRGIDGIGTHDLIYMRRGTRSGGRQATIAIRSMEESSNTSYKAKGAVSHRLSTAHIRYVNFTLEISLIGP